VSIACASDWLTRSSHEFQLLEITLTPALIIALNSSTKSVGPIGASNTSIEAPGALASAASMSSSTSDSPELTAAPPSTFVSETWLSRLDGYPAYARKSDTSLPA
jgi:hypothetical protein